MMNAWMVVNAFLRGGSFMKMEEAFLDAAKRAGLKLQIKTNAQLMDDTALMDAPRKILFFDKDLRLARRLEAKGARLFNSEGAISVCDDKTLTSLALEEQGVAQPKTLICPMTYPGIGYGDMAFLEEAADLLHFPMVVKEGKGSFGQQVYLVRDMEGLQALVCRLGSTEILFQEYISETAGRDIRLYVVGNQVIASIERVNLKGDFRANLENGASARHYTPSREETALALKASRACGTDFAGIDLLQSKRGPLICEVNSNAHFLGLRSVTGIDPAESIIELMKAAT